MGKYLTLVGEQDIYITKNGKNIAKLSGIKQSKVDIAKSLFGLIPNDGTTLEQVRKERRSQYETVD